MTTPSDEPTVALDAYTEKYLLLRAKRAEKRRLDAEVDQLEKEFRQLVGDAHVGQIAGREVFTNRPIRTFQGKKFAEDHPVIAKTYTRIVEKPELDLLALERDHPALYALYQSRQFRILEVE